MQSKESLYEKLSEYKDCFVPSEVMKILRVSKNTCYKMLEDGYIKAYKVYGNYRIPKEAVIDYIVKYGYVNSDIANENRRKAVKFCSRLPKTAKEIAMHIGITVGYCKSVLIQGLVNTNKLKIVFESKKVKYVAVTSRKRGNRDEQI